MNNPIKTYEDLVAYQAQLTVSLAQQKQVIRDDIEEAKKHFRPLTMVAGLAAKILKPSKDHSLLVAGAGSLIDVLLKKLVLPKTGWVTRLVLPFVAKNVSTHLLADNKQGILHKVFSLINRKKKQVS